MNHDAIREYLEHAAGRTQQFGHFDCVRFAVELCFYGFGRDYREQLMYHDRRSAVRRLRAAGGLRNAFSDVLGNPVGNDMLASGDFVLYREPDTIGLILPSCVAVFVNNRLVSLPRETATTGWIS